MVWCIIFMICKKVKLKGFNLKYLYSLLENKNIQHCIFWGHIYNQFCTILYIWAHHEREEVYILTTWAWTCGVTLSQVKTSPCLMDLEPRQKGRNYSNDLFSCHQLNNTHHEWGRGTENFWTCKIHLRSVVNFRAATQKVWTEKKWFWIVMYYVSPKSNSGTMKSKYKHITCICIISYYQLLDT